ncbi:MAG: FkbM family methyltransferase [Rhodobacteraceae bacterium]|nr:FkbM family methyltransferase [Paracoccaceae bacterium]
MKDNLPQASFQVEHPKGTPEFFRSRGMRIPNDTRIIDRKRRRALRLGNYERREVEAVKAMVRPEDVVIELGAGIGYMSTFMARNRNVSKVYAFEANPALIPHIKHMHEANDVDNVEVHNALLGQRKGKANFYIRENFLASSMEEEPEGKNSPVISVEEIEVRGIKATFKEIKPSFLVCDIEGAEAKILPYADLSSLRGAVIELHPQWIGQKGVKAVFDAMHKAGLTYFPKPSNKKVVAFLKDW